MIRNSELEFVVVNQSKISLIRYDKPGRHHKNRIITEGQLSKLIDSIWLRVLLGIGKCYPFTFGFRYKGNNIQPD